MQQQVYSSPLGDLSLISHKGSLVYCNWIEDDCAPKEKRIKNKIGEATFDIVDKKVIETTVCQLDEYFRGERRDFQIPLMFYGTDFQEKVWHFIASISYGKTMAYKELAIRCGSATLSRAVASACGKNPIAIIIPCHRVVASNNTLGGYTGGLPKKSSLLNLETRHTG